MGTRCLGCTGSRDEVPGMRRERVQGTRSGPCIGGQEERGSSTGSSPLRSGCSGDAGLSTDCSSPDFVFSLFNNGFVLLFLMESMPSLHTGRGGGLCVCIINFLFF